MVVVVMNIFLGFRKQTWTLNWGEGDAKTSSNTRDISAYHQDLMKALGGSKKSTYLNTFNTHALANGYFLGCVVSGGRVMR
jgi:hypothetical protein